MIHLMDTNIIGDLVRIPQESAAVILAERNGMDMVTSVIVEDELRYGCRKKGSDRVTGCVEAFLAEIEIRGIDSTVARAYGRIRAFLEARGKVLSGNDLWTAAHAISRDAVSVSGNLREFSRVPDLGVENWLDPQPS